MILQAISLNQAVLRLETSVRSIRRCRWAFHQYDARDFVAELRHMEITPHIARNDTNRRSAVDERTTRHAGYQLSQKGGARLLNRAVPDC